jgi:hypothetical protein
MTDLAPSMSPPPGLINSAPPVEPEFGDVLGKVGSRWPAIQPHLNTFVVKHGDQKNNIGGGYLEFYPPWELHNPHPGKSTIEIFDKSLTGKGLEDAVAGDMLHLLGAKDPRTERPVDPNFYEMKQRLLSTLTPEQLAVDQRAFQQDKARNPNDERTFGEWMETSRGDAYIRGWITPDANDEWRKQGVYTPEQQTILEEMRGYLERPAQ